VRGYSRDEWSSDLQEGKVWSPFFISAIPELSHRNTLTGYRERRRVRGKSQTDFLRVPGRVPGVGRGQDVVFPFDLDQSPRADELNAYGVVGLYRHSEHRNKVVLELRTDFIQSSLRDDESEIAQPLKSCP
jgi:hypothetical protein